MICPICERDIVPVFDAYVVQSDRHWVQVTVTAHCPLCGAKKLVEGHGIIVVKTRGKPKRRHDNEKEEA